MYYIAPQRWTDVVGMQTIYPQYIDTAWASPSGTLAFRPLARIDRTNRIRHSMHALRVTMPYPFYNPFLILTI